MITTWLLLIALWLVPLAFGMLLCGIPLALLISVWLIVAENNYRHRLTGGRF